jgi:hypothetical protein
VSGATPTQGDTALVTLGAEETESRFSATLTPAPGASVTINAPAAGGSSTEIWTVICGPVWRCEVNGPPSPPSPPPISRWAGGVQTLRFRPWPEEKLTLTFTSPQGVAGPTLTVDSARLDVTPGTRLQDVILTLQGRASRAGTLTLTPPEGAEIVSLKVNGAEKPAQLHDGTLRVEVNAGSQPVELSWRQSVGSRIFYRTPRVKIDGGAVNTEVQIHLPADRWLVYTHGPQWGPAILFWGLFIVALIAAVALGGVPHSPLTSLQWALLAAGLTQVHPVAGFIVVFWFFALRLRALRPAPGRWRFNLGQLGLAFWTAAFLVCIGSAVYHGLAVHPNMQVAGAGSSGNFLRWQQDRISEEMARPLVISLPMGVYKVLMFAWALWLAWSLVRWLRDGWHDFSSGGLWKPAPPKVRPPPIPSPASPSHTPENPVTPSAGETQPA